MEEGKEFEWGGWTRPYRRVIEEMAAATPTHPYKKGDVLCHSWGYSNTYADFYEVVELVGATKVKMIGLAPKVVSGDFMMGTVVPTKSPVGTSKVYVVSKKGGYSPKDPGVSMGSQRGKAYLWNGIPQNYDRSA